MGELVGDGQVGWITLLTRPTYIINAPRPLYGTTKGNHFLTDLNPPPGLTVCAIRNPKRTELKPITMFTIWNALKTLRQTESPPNIIRSPQPSDPQRIIGLRLIFPGQAGIFKTLKEVNGHQVEFGPVLVPARRE